MSEPKLFSVAAVQQKREQTSPAVSTAPLAAAPPAAPRASPAPAKSTATTAEASGGFTLPFDPVRLVAAVQRREEQAAKQRQER